jgi:hypothetical protein
MKLAIRSPLHRNRYDYILMRRGCGTLEKGPWPVFGKGITPFHLSSRMQGNWSIKAQRVLTPLE